MTEDPMTHDPLCQKANVMEIRFGNVCAQCDLIARVREDERRSASVAALTQDSAVVAYAAALRDAVEAVKAVWLRTRSQYEDRPYDAEVIAAIEALGGQS